MKIIFQVDGGIGKSIAATAVCKAIRAQYPGDELIVITGYPEVRLSASLPRNTFFTGSSVPLPNIRKKPLTYAII